METVVEEAGPTRPPRRDRTKPSKALELERATHRVLKGVQSDMRGFGD